MFFGMDSTTRVQMQHKTTAMFITVMSEYHGNYTTWKGSVPGYPTSTESQQGTFSLVVVLVI